MKRILIFSTAYLPLIGGAEIAVKEITDRLGDDFYFDLICARIKKDLPEEEQIGRIKVYRVGPGWGRLDKFLLPWRGSALARKLQQQKGYQAIWAIMASFGGLTALFFKNKFSGVPYVLTLQEGDTPGHIRSRAVWLGPYFKKIFTKADALTAISKFLQEFALVQGVKKQIEIIPNGVDLKLFFSDCPEAELENLKKQLGKAAGDKFIIHTGRLTAKNALDDIIKALKYLPDNVKFLSLGNGEELEKLKSLAEETGVGQRVIFLNQLEHGQMVKYLKISDIFVRPSLSEGLGNSFLEAMAAGLPVIATPVGGIVDFLRDPLMHPGQPATGLFCEVKNPQSIAEKVKIYLTDENLAAWIKNNAREMITNNYDWNLVADKMKNIFIRII